MTGKNVLASYIIVVLSKKLLYFLRIRTGSKLILIGKAEDVRGERFLGSVISESR